MSIGHGKTTFSYENSRWVVGSQQLTMKEKLTNQVLGRSLLMEMSSKKPFLCVSLFLAQGYLKLETCGMTSPNFVSEPKSSGLLLILQRIYSVFLLLKQKFCVPKSASRAQAYRLLESELWA